MSITAYHECGHAVMARHVGAVVTHITIEPEPGQGRYGDTQIQWAGDWRENRDSRQRAAMVALAGPAAEMIHRQTPYHPGLVAEWAEDWRLAWTAYEPLAREERQRLKVLEQVTQLVFDHLYQDGVWAAVAALADELEAHESLDREMIESVLEAWMG